MKWEPKAARVAYSPRVCGFAGIVSPRSERAIEIHEIASMVATLVHRGPDDEATVIQPGFAVGFRRLAIVDPMHGRQPMSTEDGALVLVCNGEIYNHADLRADLASRGVRFRTRSDSEVVLHAYREWGSGCAERLRGIFAFVVWDGPRRTLFLCRDRSGVKPLFFRVQGHELFFASEAKAILAHPSTPRRIDLLGCFAPSEPDALLEPSPFQGISQLGAGCCLMFDAVGDTRLRRYWTYAPTLQFGREDEGTEDIARFREELLQVVPMQLMADVPIGAYLSGGLDSSVVTAIARSRIANLPTFTSVCAGSEDPWFAYLLSSRARSHPAHFVRFAPEELLEELPHVAWGAEGAFDLGFVGRYQTAAAASRQGLKVLLSGQGADELLGGYEMSYAALARLAGRAAIAGQLLSSGWPTIASALRTSAESEAHDLALHLRRGHAALSHYLLRFEDRMGMLAGVEVRVPFLDHRLVEICAGVTGARRRRLFGDKRLLREAALGIVPDGIRLRAKFAFNGNLPPITQLLASVGRDTTASTLLTERAIEDKAYFDKRQVQRLQVAGDYHSLDAVLIVQMLDELFVTSFDPTKFACVRVPTSEITVDASWMPGRAVLFFARKGPSPEETPRLKMAVTHFGLLHDVRQVSPCGPRLLAVQVSDGRRTLTPVPDTLDAAMVMEFLRAVDGVRNYASLATSLSATVQTVLAIGRFLSAEELLEHDMAEVAT
jgi:asparagine synthase (glutamine-hydrolysing)